MAAPDFQDAKVAARFTEYDDAMREKLLALRSLIFEVAAANDEVGRIEETLKWNEPAYLNPAGTTIRLNAHKGGDSDYAFYVHCQTDLVDRYRQLYGDRLRFDGNRGVIFASGEPLPSEAVKHCLAMALTYRLK